MRISINSLFLNLYVYIYKLNIYINVIYTFIFLNVYTDVILFLQYICPNN